MIFDEYLTEKEKEKVARLFPEDSLPDALLSILSDAIGKLPEPGEKPAETPDPENEEFHGITVSESPWLEMTWVIEDSETGEFFARMKFHDMHGEITRALIRFADIYDGHATRALFAHGYLPEVIGSYRPSPGNVARVDTALFRAIYEWRAKYSHPPVDDDADPGDETF